MEYVTLTKTADPKEARTIFQLLESNGFHPWMPGGHEHTYVQLDTTIQIPESELDAANELLEAYEGGAPAETETDPSDDGAAPGD